MFQMYGVWIIPAIILIIVLAAIVTSIKIVNTGYLYVVERFGQYHRTLEPGWHFIIPFVDFVRRKISTKQQILDIQPQNVITKDNVKISIDNVIFYKVLNSKDAVYNIEDYKSGIVYSTITNMRNIVRSEEHTSELQSRQYLVCRLLLEKKKKI